MMAIGGGDFGASEMPWWCRPGWHAPARAEMVVVVGFLFTLALLTLVFSGGGGAGSLPAPFSPSRTEFAQKPGNYSLSKQSLLGRSSFSCAHVFTKENSEIFEQFSFDHALKNKNIHEHS